LKAGFNRAIMQIARKSAKCPHWVCINTSTDVRLSTPIAKGTHIAMQRGRFRLQGRWNAGPLGFNLSKSGVSASVKTSTGTFNVLKPRYSSLKFAGVQVRGKNAIYLQLATLALAGAALLAVLAIRLAIFVGWLAYFLGDLVMGFARGARHGAQRCGDIAGLDDANDQSARPG
jgi:hypothetical protein